MIFDFSMCSYVLRVQLQTNDFARFFWCHGLSARHLAMRYIRDMCAYLRLHDFEGTRVRILSCVWADFNHELLCCPVDGCRCQSSTLACALTSLAH